MHVCIAYARTFLTECGAGQEASKLQKDFLSLLPQHACIWSHLAFYIAAGDLNSSLSANAESTLIPSAISLACFLIFLVYGTIRNPGKCCTLS